MGPTGIVHIQPKGAVTYLFLKFIRELDYYMLVHWVPVSHNSHHFMHVPAGALLASAALFLSFHPSAFAATRTVTNLNDSGPGSLRNAVSIAAAGDTIVFSVEGSVILTSGQITIGKSLNIVGSADFRNYVSCNQEERLLQITGGTVTISNLGFSSGGAIGLSGSVGSADNKDGGNGSEARGGGLYNTANVTLTNCSFRSNLATGGSGGEAYSDGGRGGSGAPGRGGAIYNEGTAILIQCTFYNNAAAGGNAGNAANSGLEGNGGDGAAGEGGAIYNTGDLGMVNCTFVKNYSRGGYGGAGLVGGSGGNASGGGIFEGSGTTSILNTVVALNTLNPGPGSGNLQEGGAAPDGAALGPDCFGSIESLGHNLIGITDGSTGWKATDIRGTSLKPLDPAVGGYGSYPGNAIVFLIDSPAIDAGDDSVLNQPYALETDARGRPRKLGAHVDIGAYEFDPPQTGPGLVVTTLHDHVDEQAGTYDCTLGEAVAYSVAFSNPTITFAPGLTGTLQLLPDPFHDPPIAHFYIDHTVQIMGPGADLLTIRGGANLGKIFANVGQNVSISGLTLAGAQAGPGAAIHNYGTLTVSACAFTDNQTVLDGAWTLPGGAIFNGIGANEVWLIVSNCTFNRNTARDGGGAIASISVATIANCTFNGNSAPKGGAIFIDSYSEYLSYVDIQSCTISGNSAIDGENRGGGIYAASGTVQLENSIVAGNTASAGAPDLFGPFTSAGNNLVGILDLNASGFSYSTHNDIVGSPDRPIDPRLAPLASNGGPTLTMALLADSLAIDNGANAPERDQRGYIRTGNPDIGAFEFNGTLPVSLANISTRARVETGDNVLIGGFIISGSHTKKVMLRALGSSLPVSDALADPVLELHNSSGALIKTNDNWSTNENRQEIIDSGLQPASPLESSILTVLAPGSYTAIVRGSGNGSGVALVEAYDLDRTSDSELANISTRGLVLRDDNVMIGGFIVLGADNQSIIIRALGPSLPVTGRMDDPTLELYNQDGASIAVNDDWRSGQENEIVATGLPPPNELEAAINAVLRPGAYTAIVRGKGETTGVALIEVYGLE